MKVGECYFSATAMAGRIYVQGIGDRGPWDPKQLVYLDESVVDMLANPHAGDLKVRTAEELRDVIRVSKRGLPTLKLWICEDLEETAQKIWEQSCREIM